jgi:hypothetical protein
VVYKVALGQVSWWALQFSPASYHSINDLYPFIQYSGPIWGHSVTPVISIYTKDNYGTRKCSILKA